MWRWNDGACMRAGLAQSFPDTGRRLLADRLRQRRAERLRRLQALIEGHDTGARSALPSGEASYLADLLSEDAMEGPDAAGAASAAGAGGRRALLGGGKCRQSSVLFDLRLLELSDVPFYPDQLQVCARVAVWRCAVPVGRPCRTASKRGRSLRRTVLEQARVRAFGAHRHRHSGAFGAGHAPGLAASHGPVRPTSCSSYQPVLMVCGCRCWATRPLWRAGTAPGWPT